MALLVCGAACSILTGTLLAFFRTETPERVSHPAAAGLTFAERVSYQRAIEDVYWRHRIWPKERLNSKPSLDAVMSQAELEKKVADYLRSSQALEDYWQQPITAEQLQAEMERMAQHTEQPEVLRELFEALGNDPSVVAECVARPALAERLVTNLYAHDQRIHGQLKQRAEADLQVHNTVEQMKQTSGTYREIEFAKSDSGGAVGQAHRLPNKQGADGASALQRQDSERNVKLNSREWDETVHKLSAILSDGAIAAGMPGSPGASAAGGSAAQGAPVTEIKTGVISPLQEDENRYYATAVVKKTKEQLSLATVEWPKEPVESWRARVENQLPKVMAAVTSNYTLPKISEGAGCIEDTWTATNGPPDPRSYHTAIWTGSEMIVWGGSILSNMGGKYTPGTDSWTPTSTTNAPAARTSHTAVWTGMEMIIWGGQDENFPLNTGGKYNPSTDSWIATSIANAPAARSSHTAVWTGNEMIIWGGDDRFGHRLNTGGRYNPNTDSWTATSTINAPAARDRHTAVWAGGKMIVWGGQNNVVGGLNTGGRYNPSSNSWATTSTTNAPTARDSHTAVWTGSEMIVWGGGGGNTGGRYNPNTDNWTATSTINAPGFRFDHTAVWTGIEMIIWGGDGPFYLNTGGRYNPSTNTWAATSTANAPTARGFHTAVWTGHEMIIWGGSDNDNQLNSGGRYNPNSNSWTATNINVPASREFHTAVWTGSEMIVWGGVGTGFSYLNSGGRYNPSTDNWTATSTTNAPDARFFHTAVWTGSEMIIWGGAGQSDYLNTGGRYNPATNNWTATSTTNAPTARYLHTAVWTGNEMIVWGGFFYDTTEHYLNTGGRYNPGTNSWTATSITNGPSGRDDHTAVWTGTEMIVWGGVSSSGLGMNTGGRYNPVTNSWTATSTTNAPSGRNFHTAVWTGNEMIVWGGYFYDTGDHYLNTGGRYNPDTNSWTFTSTANAPAPRSTHTAVWTNNEMILWGGYFSDGNDHFLNTGGRYHPGTDSWTATSTTNSPDGRSSHTAVWTGSEMILWGGQYGPLNIATSTGGRYCASVSQLGNISTRAFVQTGDNVMIGGFIVQGAQTKKVIIRAIGPELGAPPYNIPNALANPTLELHTGMGALIASNDNWPTTIIGGIITSNQVGAIRDSGHAPIDGRESAIIADLQPGNYTAIVRDVHNVTGVALVEVYDLSANSASILSNISTRSFVQTGDNVMIGGFIVQGTGAKRVIIRAIGPELGAPPYNIPNALANPRLELHSAAGALIGSNDDWQHTIIGGVITQNQVADIQNSSHAPTDPSESAIIAELPPGNYTAIVRGVNDTTGVGLVEVYDLN